MCFFNILNPIVQGLGKRCPMTINFAIDGIASAFRDGDLTINSLDVVKLL